MLASTGLLYSNPQQSGTPRRRMLSANSHRPLMIAQCLEGLRSCVYSSMSLLPRSKDSMLTSPVAASMYMHRSEDVATSFRIVLSFNSASMVVGSAAKEDLHSRPKTMSPVTTVEVSHWRRDANEVPPDCTRPPIRCMMISTWNASIVRWSLVKACFLVCRSFLARSKIRQLEIWEACMLAMEYTALRHVPTHTRKDATGDG